MNIAYLRFKSEAQWQDIGERFGWITDPPNRDVLVLGKLHRFTGATEVAGGFDQPVTVESAGYHVNLFYTDEFPPELQPFIVKPEFPKCVYSGLDRQTRLSFEQIPDGVAEVGALPETVVKIDRPDTTSHRSLLQQIKAARQVVEDMFGRLDAARVAVESARAALESSIARRQASAATISALIDRRDSFASMIQNYSVWRQSLVDARDAVLAEFQSATGADREPALIALVEARDTLSHAETVRAAWVSERDRLDTAIADERQWRNDAATSEIEARRTARDTELAAFQAARADIEVAKTTLFGLREQL